MIEAVLDVFLVCAGGALLGAWLPRLLDRRVSRFERVLVGRVRAVVPSTRPQSAIASGSDATTRAAASTSSAPDARAVASGLGKSRGFTSHKSCSPMFFMARATAPMLPGCDVSTSTKRMGSKVLF